MKKIIATITLLISSVLCFAQNKNHVAFQAVPFYAPNDGWSTGSVEFNAMYMRDLGKIFHLGAGAGVGIAEPVRFRSGWKLGSDVEMKQKAIMVPLFIKGKIDFCTKRSRPYAAIRMGTKISQVDGFGNEEFNPYIAMVSPSIGYDIKIGKHKLGIELVADANFGRYEEIHFAYNSTLNNYIYDRHELKTDSVWASYGISVIFEL